MGTEVKYRVGVPWTLYPGDGFTYLMHGSNPDDSRTFTQDAAGLAALYDAKQMATWVQVLASRHEAVVVERVEVARD